jgi:hypothetical protein
MDAVVNKPLRNSRWTREAVTDDGHAAVVYPTERDIEISISISPAGTRSCDDSFSAGTTGRAL